MIFVASVRAAEENKAGRLLHELLTPSWTPSKL
jgi:hypothetical protein